LPIMLHSEMAQGFDSDGEGPVSDSGIRRAILKLPPIQKEIGMKKANSAEIISFHLIASRSEI